MANKGIPPDESKQEYPRQGMIKGFGDVSFSLPVGGSGWPSTTRRRASTAGTSSSGSSESGDDRRLNPIIETLRGASGRVHKVLIQEERGPHKIAEVIQLAKERGLPYHFVPGASLT